MTRYALTAAQAAATCKPMEAAGREDNGTRLEELTPKLGELMETVLNFIAKL